ncbi:hypothetical protein B566_EDAN016275 [Ephemera danica]|nr:hypothetical protein B566_EDAN016275 [Ephemera danica]
MFLNRNKIILYFSFTLNSTKMATYALVVCSALLIVLLLQAEKGSCIKCWVCRSDSDPKCADPFDNSTVPITDCRQEKELPHLPGIRPNLCLLHMQQQRWLQLSTNISECCSSFCNGPLTPTHGMASTALNGAFTVSFRIWQGKNITDEGKTGAMVGEIMCQPQLHVAQGVKVPVETPMKGRGLYYTPCCLQMSPSKIFGRIISVLLYSFAIHYVSCKEALAIMNVRLLLLESIILLFSRDAMRQACQQSIIHHDWPKLFNKLPPYVCTNIMTNDYKSTTLIDRSQDKRGVNVAF